MPEVLSDTHIQFHLYQRHFLAVRSNYLAMYEAIELKCCNQVLSSFPNLWCGFSPFQSELFLTKQVYILFVSCQWVPEVSMAISQATFSFDGQAVYASLLMELWQYLILWNSKCVVGLIPQLIFLQLQGMFFFSKVSIFLGLSKKVYASIINNAIFLCILEKKNF